MLGLTGLGLFVHAEGGWPDTAGIDENMVGSAFGVNADAGGTRVLDVVEVVLGWTLLDDFLTVLVGKIDPEDSQGLGLFGRYGYADDKRNDISGFWSVGVQYQGLFAGQDEDVLGLGFAQGAFSDLASTTFPADNESIVEIYYSARFAPWVATSPSIQYVVNPGGNANVDNAVVGGARAQVDF